MTVRALEDPKRTRAERDLYLRLLQLGGHGEVKALLDEALRVIADATGARLAYLELHDEGGSAAAPRWFAVHGLDASEVERVRSLVSSGIIAEALATGTTIVTPSALHDARFSNRASVRTQRIEAVLCAPIEASEALGVLYLQGHTGVGAFSSADRAAVDVFARSLAPLADRLLARERLELDPTREVRERLRCGGVVGRSAALAAVLGQIALVAPLEVSVLLTGDSGTGKSQIARVIHDNSPRARGPFVELNCGALPESLLESELFGAMPGAHSTALRRIDGKVAAAEHGTLLLDEIGDLAPGAQAKLLQLLQSRQYHALGSARPATADVRIIAATSSDLDAAVRQRRFREDLYYRLQVLPLRMPSLAERRDDVAELAAHFCGVAADRHGLPKLELSPTAIRAAELADWPGNVRQLAHAMEVATIRATGEGAQRIEPRHVFSGALDDTGAEPSGLTFVEATRRFQARLLREALDASDWNVASVASQLELARSHLYTLIRAYGLKRA
jgi:Nif-specific regulatory protein